MSNDAIHHLPDAVIYILNSGKDEVVRNSGLYAVTSYLESAKDTISLSVADLGVIDAKITEIKTWMNLGGETNA